MTVDELVVTLQTVWDELLQEHINKVVTNLTKHLTTYVVVTLSICSNSPSSRLHRHLITNKPDLVTAAKWLLVKTAHAACLLVFPDSTYQCAYGIMLYFLTQPISVHTALCCPPIPRYAATLLAKLYMTSFFLVMKFWQMDAFLPLGAFFASLFQLFWLLLYYTCT